jgi:WD40 repeat protein
MQMLVALCLLATSLKDGQIVVQAGEENPPQIVAFSPTDHLLAGAGDRAHGVRLWDLDSHLMVRLLQTVQVGGLLFAPDGKTLAVLGSNETQIFDVATGALRFTDGHEPGIGAFSSDGKRLLSLDRRGSANIWTLGQPGRKTLKLEPFDRALWRPGTEQALIERKGAYSFFDAATGSSTPVTTTAALDPHAIFSSDGARLVFLRGRELLILDGGTLVQVAAVKLPEPPKGTEKAVASVHLPSGNVALVIVGEKLLRIDLRDGTVVSTIPWLTPQGAEALLQSSGIWPRHDNFDRSCGKVIGATFDGALLIETGQSGAFYPRETNSGSITGAFGEKSTLAVGKLAFEGDKLLLIAPERQVNDAPISRRFDLYSGRELPPLATGAIRVGPNVKSSSEWTVLDLPAAPGRPRGCQVYNQLTERVLPGKWVTFNSADLYAHSAEEQFCNSRSLFSKSGDRMLVWHDTAELWDLRKTKRIAQVPLPKEWTESHCAIADDDRHFVCGTNTGSAISGSIVFDATTGAQVGALAGSLLGLGPKDVALTYDTSVHAWSMLTGKALPGSLAFRSAPWSWAITQDESFAAINGSILGDEGWSWNLGTGEIKKIEEPTGAYFALTPNDKLLLSTAYNGDILISDFPSGTLKKRLVGHAGRTTFTISPDGARILSAGEDGAHILWDLEKGEPIVRIGLSGDDWVMVTPENQYMGEGAALDQIALRFGDRASPLGQFDLALNRPDLVLARLGKAPAETLDIFKQSYLRRLGRLGLDPAKVGVDTALPELKLAAVPPSSSLGKVQVEIQATSENGLRRIQAEINGVPALGPEGLLLPGAPKTLKQTLSLELSAGTNLIKLRAVDAAGGQSTPLNLLVHNDAPPRRPDLYAVAIGVSKYQADPYSLRYAAKDAQDLLQVLQTEKKLYGEIKVMPILDGDATLEGIAKAKEFLAPAQIDDVVIVFAAGHGLLDDNARYFFATHDIDFEHPAARGLPFEQIEGLVSGVRARHRLILLDTCASGETDEEEVARKERSGGGKAVVASRGFIRKASGRSLASDTGLLISRELFSNVAETSGASIIASSSGVEYSFESDKLKNGVFTYALIEALRADDVNTNGGDDAHHVNDLRKHVGDRVEELTAFAQHPTARQRNGEDDFAVFKVIHQPRQPRKARKR